MLTQQGKVTCKLMSSSTKEGKKSYFMGTIGQDGAVGIIHWFFEPFTAIIISMDAVM